MVAPQWLEWAVCEAAWGSSAVSSHHPPPHHWKQDDPKSVCETNRRHLLSFIPVVCLPFKWFSWLGRENSSVSVLWGCTWWACVDVVCICGKFRCFGRNPWAEIIYFCTTTGAFKMSSVHDIGRAQVYLLLYMNECMHLSVHVYVCTSEWVLFTCNLIKQILLI